ncbi:HotDog domain-containing protein [Umbelopsis sp. AD052]|nr:HotDog domain-containing protein [Umbelopsis sp. AD052]
MSSSYKVDVEKAVGHESAPEKVSFNRRDLLLYALAVGVKEDELQYLYELDPNFTGLPFYPIVLPLKGSGSDINSYKERSSGAPTPGIPPFDGNKLVHGEQTLEVINPIPTNGGDFIVQKKLTGVYDKGSGMVLESTATMTDASGKVYTKMVSKAFVRGYGGWNGPKGPKPVSRAPPKRNPDAVDTFKTGANQALLYRLSGDYNPLHADVELAPRVGFPKPILHGLCSFGISAHAILKALGENDASRFKSIEARFASPVFPGETLETYMWKVEGPSAGEEGVIFVTKVKERDIVVINNGYVVLKKAAGQSKL